MFETIKKGIKFSRYPILATCLILFFLNALDVLEIKSSYLKMFVYFISLVIAPALLLKKLILSLQLNNKAKLGIFVIGLSLILILNIPLVLYDYTSTWKTQTIDYENVQNSNERIEFQMLDIGARGYKRRRVKVRYFSPFLMRVSEVPSNIDSNPNWEKVDIDLNELGLKGG